MPCEVRALALAVLLLAAPACAADRACSETACADAGAKLADDERGVRATSRAEACATQSAVAMRASTRPLDVVFVIDNSASMTEEIAAVRANINVNFAAILRESGADFRVIMVSRFGTDGTNVCVEPPLAGAPCSAGLHPSDSPVFFHYNAEISSTDAFCRILSAFDQPDAEQRAPYGFQSFLRPEAHKAFVVITDDNAACGYEENGERVQFGSEGEDAHVEALAFHQALLRKSPEQFGVPPDVRYQFYSFVGMRSNAPESEPWFPHHDLQPETCATASGPGLSYQALSIVTDSLRYPVCEGRGFDAVFRVLAHSVVESTKADCVFDIPTPPEGQFINRLTIAIEYREGGGDEVVQFSQIADAADCDERSFRIRDDRLELCPAACAQVQADEAAQIDVLYACLVDVE